MYKAKNVDTDKALEYINESRKCQERAENLEITSVQKYHEGIRKGFDIVEEIFFCSICESKAGTYQDGVRDVIYELGKELDVKSQDIRDSGNTMDSMCAMFANRIRDAFMSDISQQD